MTTLDHKLIKVLSSKENFGNFAEEIPQQKVSDKNVLFLLQMFGAFFKAHPKVHQIDRDDFFVWLFEVHKPTLKEEKRAILTSILNKSFDDPTSHDVAREVIARVILRGYLQELSEASLKAIEGHADVHQVIELATLCDEFNARNFHLENSQRAEDWRHLYTHQQLLEKFEGKGEGYLWNLQVLNRSFGRARTSKMVIIAGCSNSGKTALALCEALTIVRQMPKEKKVIVINNEEESSELYLRAYQIAEGLFSKNIPDLTHKLEVWDLRGANTFEIDNLLSLHKEEIGVIIFNMLDNVTPVGVGSNGDFRIGIKKVYDWARHTAIKYDALVFSLCQASVSAENKERLSMHDLSEDKTHKPGAADGIIMIGRHELDEDKSNLRYISVPKNKFATDDVQVPKFRHVYGEKVSFDEESGGVFTNYEYFSCANLKQLD